MKRLKSGMREGSPLLCCPGWAVAGGLVLTSLAKKVAVFTVVVCVDVYRSKTCAKGGRDREEKNT